MCSSSGHAEDARTILASANPFNWGAAQRVVLQESVTELLPGQLAYIFGVSILDAALLSWLALLWYRRSVRRLMREGALETVRPPADSGQRPVLTETAVGGGEPGGFSMAEEHPELIARPFVPRRAGLGRLILAYCAGAAAYAAVITTLKFTAEPSPFPAVAWLVDWWTNTWPIVPTLVALLVLDRPVTAGLAIIYVVGGALAIALFTTAGQLLRGTLNSAPVTNVFWAMVGLAWTASIPLAFIVLTGWRRVRAVMPLALAATLLFGFGSMFFREMLIRALDVGALRSLFLGGAVLSSVATMQYALFMIVSLPVGWIAWRLLTALAEAFASKRFSDVQLVIDCWWVVATAEVTATTLSVTRGFTGIVGGLAAFLLYRLSVFAVLRGFRPPEDTPRRLLLLRVFGYQTRTESLFDRIAQAWRFHGPVQLIAGVDLAMRTADPGDLLALLNGRLAELYVRTPQGIGDRLGRLDLQADPDGRFRINEVYCHANTWKPMLEALLDATDTVLMDLRSFSTHNAGCIFELEQLVRRLASDDIVLVCDNTTDLPLLRRILGDAWAAACRDGRTRGPGRISVVRVDRQSRTDLGFLMQRLLKKPHPAGVPM
jgi:hypothetical protein